MQRLLYLLRLTRAHVIARRYFVVNGFDGALAMLGVVMGFYVSGEDRLEVVISTCLGGAVALTMSGISSAYVSEAAERNRELRTLQEAMLADLGESVHGHATRLVPVVIAAVNGLAPLAVSLFIMLPLWLSLYAPWFRVPPLESSIAAAMLAIFLLGVFLGRISGLFWLLAGTRTLLVAAATCGIIFWVAG